VAVGQTACEQLVPLGHFWQPPEALHLPVFPQLEAVGSGGQKLAGAGVFSATGAQVPDPFTLHAWQEAQLGVLQQTPSTQLPVAHWLPAVPQAVPLRNLTTQFPVATPGFWQKLPAAHWLSSVQPATVHVPVVAPGS
jgi:hypothetical protein